MTELTGYEDHQLDRVEEILDANPSTSAEVYRSTIDLDPRAIAAVAAKRAGDGAGGFTLIAETTDSTNPDDFTVLPLLDCEGPGFIYLRSDLLSFDEDGETVGTDTGDICFDLSNYTAGRESNALSTPPWWLTDWRGWDVNTFMSEVGQWIGVTIPTERYVQPWLQVFTSIDGQVYAGANNPTGTFLTRAYKFDVTVLAG